ncbi:hypothetical protein BX666DRAFT_1336344 [Dichotomocladium elegans]|nr:hypothetical protein BX666DRAFT_1336344 [Dichotomocladium elegans]
MIDSQRAIKSPVRRASGSTKSNKEQKKSLRASLQKMVNPNSSGSTNRWKTKTTSKSNDKQTTVGSTTRELPSSSNRRTSQSKTAAATAICGAVVNKKMPRRPSVPAQRNAAPGSTAVPAIDSDAQTPKAPRRLTCSSTTTNTSSGRSISSFSADGSSMTSNSNDGCYPEDNGTVKDSDMRFSAGIPKHGVAAGLEADALNQHGQVKLDSAEMSYQLASAHAQLAAAKFNTAPSMKA